MELLLQGRGLGQESSALQRPIRPSCRCCCPLPPTFPLPPLSPTRAATGAAPGLPRCADLLGDIQVPQQVQVPQPGRQLPDPVRSEAQGVQSPQAVHHDGHL